MTSLRLRAATAVFAVILSGCADDRSGPVATPRAAPERGPATTRISAGQAERMQRIMLPLLAHMNDPLLPKDVKVTVWADQHINAANAGGGAFYVTSGLLQRTSDDQLRGILAHEIAHADLGHVAKTQGLATGLDIGSLILDQILPGSGAFAPIAGKLVLSAYSRNEESEADAHAVTLLSRAGLNGKRVMADSLVWIQQTEGDSGGGYFDSHPATADRVQAVRNLP